MPLQGWIIFFLLIFPESFLFLYPVLAPPSFLVSFLLPISHTSTELCSVLGDFPLLPCSYYFETTALTSVPLGLKHFSLPLYHLFCLPHPNSNLCSIFTSSIFSMIVSFLSSFFLPPTANTSHCPQVQEVMLQQPVPGSLLPAAGACSRCSASCWSVINSARTHLSQFSSRFCGCGYHPLHKFSLVLRYMGGDPPKCL